MFTVGSAYPLPEPPRVAITEDAGWRFAFAPSGSPQTPSFNDSSWAAVTLPHTWNAIDGASTNYASGDGWYRKTVTIDASTAGKKLFLDFEGGSLVTSLYVDGTQVDFKPSTASVDPHSGGFQDFLFDVTSKLTPGSHLLAVKVNNTGVADVPPSNSGDYSKLGGLYRDVSLLVLPATHVARNENVSHAGLTGADSVTPIATPGVYFGNSSVVVGATSATVTIRTVVDNAAAAAQPVTVTSYLVDAAGVIRAQQSTTQTLAGSQSGVSITQTSTIANPHLWDGRIDPYLYDLYVEVRDPATNALLDTTHKRVGIRSFALNANPNNDPNVAPFTLNGHRYTLVGADMHQDSGRTDANGNPVGWAQADAQIQADVALLIDAGATVIRTSHYEDNQAFYDYCDQVGMLVYTESPINGKVNAGDAFMINAQDQYQELVRQTYDNPSVFAWGFGNETSSSTDGVKVFTQLNSIAHTLDPSRKTGFATYGGSTSSSTNLDGISDIKGTHRYDGWYIAPAGVKAVNDTFNAYKSQPLGITEVGAGGSAYQYADSFTLPVSSQAGGVTTHYHPANQQAAIEELQMTQYASLNYLWARIVWQSFDHASSGKNEGDQGGINDKGLTTRDRTPKDSYYYFSALWNDPTRNYANRKIVYVSDHLWRVRNVAATTITAYSNVGAPTLLLNGTSKGVMTPLVISTPDGNETVADTYVLNVTLPVGDNTVTASRVYTDGVTYSNAATFAYRDAATFAKDKVVATGVAINRTFNYSPVFKTTSNPFDYALPNGVYDVRITSPSGGVNNLSLEGQTAAIDSNGTATADTFYARVTVTDGKLTIAGAAGAYNAAVSTIDISAVDTTAPTVVGAVVNGGAVQRSKIDSLAVSFDEPVTTANSAFSLGLRNPSGNGYAATFDLVGSNPSNDGITYLLSLASGSGLHSLGDGVYDLIVNAAKVADLAGNAMTTSYTSTFHRLFGDGNGDKTVDVLDSRLLRSALNGTYDATFDFNDDGFIDVLDSREYRARQDITYIY